MASIPPNQTIYVQNLYEKLPKQGEAQQEGAVAATAAAGRTVRDRTAAGDVCRPQCLKGGCSGPCTLL